MLIVSPAHNFDFWSSDLNARKCFYITNPSILTDFEILVYIF